MQRLGFSYGVLDFACCRLICTLKTARELWESGFVGCTAVVLGPCPRSVRMATALIPGRCSLLPDSLSGETEHV